MFTRKHRHSDRHHRQMGRSNRAFRKLTVEVLEDRTVLSGNPFPLLAPKINTFLSDLHSDLGTMVDSANVSLPVVNDSLKNMSAAKTAIQGFQSTLVSTLGSISNPAQAQQILANNLGPKGAQSVDVQFANNGDDVTVSIHLSKQLATLSKPFGLGLPGMPFTVNDNVSVQVSYDLSNLVFGLHNLNANTFFVNPGSLQIQLNATLASSQLDGDVGFMHFTGTDNGSHFAGAFVMDVTQVAGLSNLHLDANANATVDMHLLAGFDSAPSVTMPTIETDFHMGWSLANEDQLQTLDTGFGNVPAVQFNDVHLNLGSFVSQAIGPVVQMVQILTEPLDPIFTLLDDGLPILSELDNLIGSPLGGNDGKEGVSILDLANVITDVGVLPEPYNTLVIIAKEIATIAKDVNDIKLEGGNENAFIDFGDFDIGASQSQDLRTFLQNAAFASKDITANHWSDLVAVAGTVDLSAVKQQIANLPVVGDKINKIIDKFVDQSQNGIDLEFPIIDNFGAVISGFLVGVDSDMVTFTAQMHNLTAEVDFPFDLPLPGLEAGLFGSITGDFFFKVAYDTFGFREVLAGAPAAALADGFYFDNTTHLSVSGNVGASAGISAGIFEAKVEGGLSADLSVTLDDSNNNLDGDPNKLRWFHHGDITGSEIGDCFFHTDGSIDGYLKAYIKVGVEVLGEFVGYQKDFDIADVFLIDLTNGCINPFDTPPVLASFDPNDPTTLRLHMGAYANLRNYKPTVIDENYSVTRQRSDSASVGEAVSVSAFGFIQDYQGVKKIVAWGEDGVDIIKIDKDITSAVELHGGSGNDQLAYFGSGTATLWGDAGDDVLKGGQWQNIIYGDDNTPNTFGDGNDSITGGSGTNKLYGEGGNDTIIGGTGANEIYGGSGSDKLIAGPKTDYLDGGTEDDQLTAGLGSATFLGNRGNDIINWTWENGVPVLIDGGSPGEDNTLSLVISQFNDTVTFSKTGPQSKLLTKVIVPNLLNIQFQAANIQEVSLEAGDGEDSITVNDLTNSTIHKVGVNLSDVLSSKKYIGDQVPDHIVINGTSGSDIAFIEAVNAKIQAPDHPREDPLFGGIMQYSGLPTYKVLAANVIDDHKFYGLQSNDNITILSNTGPVKILGGDGNDTINALAAKPGDYLSPFTIDAGSGSLNKLNVNTTASGLGGSLYFTQTQITSNLFPGINYLATAGQYGGGVDVSTGSGPDFIYLKSTLPGLATSINTNGGNDMILVSSNGTLQGSASTILGTLSVDAGPGSNNTLKLTDSVAVTGNANVQINASQVLGFAGPGDTTVVNYKATAGQLNLQMEGSNSANLIETFRLVSPSALVTLNANAGNDVVNVSSLSKAAVVNGGNGNDTVTAGYLANKLDSISASLSFYGQQGQDVFHVLDTALVVGKTYQLGSSAFSRQGIGPIQFDNSLETLNLSTGTASDGVTMLGMPVSVVTNLNLGNGSDAVVGPNATNTWKVTSNNLGTLNNSVKFTAVENLTGGTSNDRFLLNNAVGVTGSIQGGFGNDTLDYGQYQTAVIFNLQNNSANNLGQGFGSIESFNGGTQIDKLIGPNNATIWDIVQANQGMITSVVMPTSTFASIENLIAGTGPDIFRLTDVGSLLGEINAQAGAAADTLDFSLSTKDITVNITTNMASQVGKITGIENVFGGKGNDILIGNAGVNVLKGGDGNDILLGGDGSDELWGELGRDLLIGGMQIDQLNGGSDDDILIGGQTTYDQNLAALQLTSLQLIMKEWTSNTSYDDRLNHLRNGGGLNGNIVLNTSTYLNDLAIDIIKGGANDDWFWADHVEILDLNQPPERIG